MSKARILIIEDSGTKRTMYRDLLEKEGYSVLTADSGEEGIRKALSDSPDVIITDLTMPKVDGLHVAKSLKDAEKTKYIPVICVSATYKDMENKLRALADAGVEACLYSLENAPELLIKVDMMLKIRKIYLELLEKNKRLKQFNEAAIGRELKMIELKGRIKLLEEELSKIKQRR